MGRYFEQEFTVDSRAVDMFRQCRPSALLGYMQEAATLASLDLGASGPEILAKYNCIWMIARLWVEMDKPLAWNDRFTVRTWHRKTAGASVYRDFDLFQDGVPIGQGVSTTSLSTACSSRSMAAKTRSSSPTKQQARPAACGGESAPLFRRNAWRAGAWEFPGAGAEEDALWKNR